MGVTKRGFSGIGVDVILGNCTKLFVTKDQPPSISRPSRHQNI